MIGGRGGGAGFDYLPTESLFKLSHKPDMNLSKGLSQPVRYMDDNSLPVPRNINLTAAV